MRSSTCLLCEAPLEALPGGKQKHPEVDYCRVKLTDAWGIAVEVPKDVDPIADAPPEPIEFKSYPFVDEVLAEIFAKANLPRLGGVSTGRGWSSVSTFERCPHLWREKYLREKKPWILVESPSLAIGSLIHVFLASYYTIKIDPSYFLTPEVIYDACKAYANPQFVEEAWRVFTAYRLFYALEVIQPLAVEYDLKDPRTGESCRFDLIAFFPEAVAGRPAGTYVIEHKSASRFDGDTLEGWVNDGEVIGQVALWRRLGLDNYFGKLQGVIVNLLGKHKVPQFHRTLVAPESWQVDSHLDDLRRWEGLIRLATSTNSFPRARRNCIDRYGRCSYWDQCVAGEE